MRKRQFDTCDNSANRVRTVNSFATINLTEGANISGFARDTGSAATASLVGIRRIGALGSHRRFANGTPGQRGKGTQASIPN
jgi:hypothetical protein